MQSSRRLEREAQRNIELMWLTGRLVPDFKTIADFRKDNGAAIRAVCSQFVVLCRKLGLFTRAVVAIDGSKFKAVNNRDKNYTVAKVIGRMEQVDASIARYLRALDRADREESDVAEAKSIRLKEKIAALRRQMRALKETEQTVQDAPDQQVSLADTPSEGLTRLGCTRQIIFKIRRHLIFKMRTGGCCPQRGRSRNRAAFGPCYPFRHKQEGKHEGLDDACYGARCGNRPKSA